jgi:hypothetical protein
MGFIHSKLKNALMTRTVKKLVFIKLNLNTFYDYPVPDDDDVVEYNSKNDDDATAAFNDSAPEDAMESDDEDVMSM